MSCQTSHLTILFRYILNAYISEEDRLSLLTINKIEDFDIPNLLGMDLSHFDDHALRFASENGYLPVVR